MTISEEFRNQLANLALNKHSRSNAFSKERPVDWQPHLVENPVTKLPFTKVEAWQFIARKLLDGQPVTVIDMDSPLNTKGYVMEIPMADDRILYIKLQHASRMIYARSFHYSYNYTQEGTDYGS